MRSTRLLLFGLPLTALVISLIALGLRPETSVAGAGPIPAPGSDTVSVVADVSIASRIGNETIHFTGTATIGRQAPHASSGHEVIDSQLSGVDLTATSNEGNMHATLASSPSSPGEFRGVNAAPSELPATSFFDVYFNVQVPASPQPSVMLHNGAALHLVTTSNITAWPPSGVHYHLVVGATTPTPSPTATPAGGMPDCRAGIALLPQLPLFACVTGVSLTIDEAGTPTITSTPTNTPTPTGTSTPTSTRTPTFTPTPVRNGDGNCDGSVTPVDAELDLQHGAGLIAGLPCQNLADVNGDGNVDALDAELVLQFVVGLLSHLPV